MWCEWVALAHITMRVSAIRSQITDRLVDCSTDHYVHTSDLLFFSKTIFPCVSDAGALIVLKSESSSDRTVIQINSGWHPGQAVGFGGGKVVCWPRLYLSNRETEPWHLFKVVWDTTASARKSVFSECFFHWSYFKKSWDVMVGFVFIFSAKPVYFDNIQYMVQYKVYFYQYVSIFL